jgi:hypothetical protein
MWKVGDFEFPEYEWEFPNKGAIESEEKLSYYLMIKKDKVVPSIIKLYDYLEKLITDILTAYPAGKLPSAELMSQRDTDEIVKLLKGPIADGQYIYTLAWLLYNQADLKEAELGAVCST